MYHDQNNTVGIIPILRDLKGPETSTLMKLIGLNSQKGTWTKIVEKLNNFEKFERKKSQISALFLTQRPPDDWAEALDHLVIGFVANKYTKLGKTSEILLLSLGLSYRKIPLC